MSGRTTADPAGGAAGADPAAVAAALDALGGRGRPGVPVGPLTTYRVGGPAAVAVSVATVADLAAAAAAVAASGLPVLVVGRGSNLVVADAGFPGLAVVVGADAGGLTGLSVAGSRVVAGAGLPLPALARRSVAAGLGGLEWAVGVPGSVGGGVRMNAGGHGSDIAANLVAVTVVDLDGDGAPATVAADALGLGYRRSAVTAGQVVVDATFDLVPADPAVGSATIRDIVAWRRHHQPGGQNAGSVFTNPGVEVDGAVRSAGWLIETAGMKGLRVGSAEVSARHANFIQADPGGSADDVVALMLEIRRRVGERWGISLRSEHRLVGFGNAQRELEGET